MRALDPTEKAIINGLQGGFPLTHRPYRDAGAQLGLSEGEMIEEIGNLLAGGQLSRFGPLWNAEALGGAVCLAAIAVRIDDSVPNPNPRTGAPDNAIIDD